MKERLKQKELEPTSKGTLFITGGSHGIGKGIIEHLGERYGRVANYDVAESSDLDVRNMEAIRRAVNEALSHKHQNDLVVSAGVFIPKSFTEQSKEEIDFVLDVNFKGALYVAHEFLKWHEDNESANTPNIVLISSISAFHHGGKTNVVYDSTKAALSYMVKNLANFNCVANAVEPGTIRETQIGGWTPSMDFNSQAKKIVEKGQASDVEKLGRETKLEDVAKIVEILLFDNENGAINGTTITVDSGLTSMRGRF